MRLILVLVGCSLWAGAVNNEIAGVVADGNRPVAGPSCGFKAPTFRRAPMSAASSSWTWPAESPGPSPGLRPGQRATTSPDRSSSTRSIRCADRSKTAPSGGRLRLRVGQRIQRRGQSGNCQNCHSSPATPQPLFPFDEWALDAHGTSAQNRRFLSMYNGPTSAA